MLNRINRLTQEFVEDFCKNAGYILITKYVNSKEHITLEDQEGYRYSVAFYNFQNGKKPQKFGIFNKYSLYNLKRYIDKNNIDVKLLSSEYTGLKGILFFECSCGEKFETTYSAFMHKDKHQCNKCGEKIRRKKKRTPLSKVRGLFIKLGYEPLFEEYVNCETPLLCKNEYGQRGFLTYSNLRNGNTFLPFTKTNPFAIENIRIYLDNCDAECEIISDVFDGNDGILLFKCACGESYSSSWRSFYNQNVFRCRSCSSKQSKIALKVENFLKSNNLNYIKEHSFEDCKDLSYLFFDFAIFDDFDNLLFLIEVDGKQHYEKNEMWNSGDGFEGIKRRDKIKNEYCKKNNIELIRIPYWLIENSEEYLDVLKKEIDGKISFLLK